MDIRPADSDDVDDVDDVWAIIGPTIRAGETYALPSDMSREDALAYWFAPGHEVFVATDGGDVVGTYYLKANQWGGGAHVANCGYMTRADAAGRGVASSMCRHSLDHAKTRGFASMQFNLVVSTNVRAIELWKRFGFGIVGTLPGAFRHPTQGLVDAFVMYRTL